MIADVSESAHLQAKENSYANLDELVRGILLAGIDQLLQHRNFEIRKGRIMKSPKGSLVTE